MPNPVLGCSGLESIFSQYIYKCQSNAWELTAAISGAHTLGQATVANSGFNGFWSSAAQQSQFNNDYFKAIVLKGWAPELAVNGVSGKNQWKRIDHGSSQSHKEMMLDTDMCLAYRRSENNNGVNEFLLAAQSQCCAWSNAGGLFASGAFTRG